MIHLRTKCGSLLLACLSAPLMAQIPGIYLKIGLQGLEKGGKDWKAPKGPEGMPTYSDNISLVSPEDLPYRVEAGGEWRVSAHFGLRAGLAALRIQDSDYAWQQGFLDVLWTPLHRGHFRIYAAAGLGLGSMSSTYVVRKEDWVMGTTGYQYVPGDYRPVSQSGRPFLRASAGIQLTRYFGAEINVDSVFLQSGKHDPWPSSVTNVGVNLMLRIPIE